MGIQTYLQYVKSVLNLNTGFFVHKKVVSDTILKTNQKQMAPYAVYVSF